jgi:hypothetical protein
MSKVISAANAMIANPKKIGSVILGQSGSEIFFTYDGKYNWSMTNPKGNYFLFFYPVTSNYTLEQLANIEDPQEWDHVAMVRYDAQEFGTQEAMQTLAELYTVIKEKLYGVNQALDDIIGDLY